MNKILKIILVDYPFNTTLSMSIQKLLEKSGIQFNDQLLNRLEEGIFYSNIYKILKNNIKHPDYDRFVELIIKPLNYIKEHYENLDKFLKDNFEDISKNLGNRDDYHKTKVFIGNDFKASFCNEKELSDAELEFMTGFLCTLCDSNIFDIDKVLEGSNERRPVHVKFSAQNKDKSIIIDIAITNYGFDYLYYIIKHQDLYFVPELQQIEDMKTEFKNSLKSLDQIKVMIEQNKVCVTRNLLRDFSNTIEIGKIALHPGTTILLTDELDKIAMDYKENNGSEILKIINEIFLNTDLEGNITCELYFNCDHKMYTMNLTICHTVADT